MKSQSTTQNQTIPNFQNLYNKWKRVYNEWLEFSLQILKKAKKKKIKFSSEDTKKLNLINQNINLYDRQITSCKLEKEAKGVLKKKMNAGTIYQSLIDQCTFLHNLMRDFQRDTEFTGERIMKFFILSIQSVRLFADGFQSLCDKEDIIFSTIPIEFIHSIDKNIPKKYLKLSNFWTGKTILEMYEKLFNPIILLIDDQNQNLLNYQAQKSVDFNLTPFLQFIKMALMDIKESEDVIRSILDPKEPLKNYFPEMVEFFRYVLDFFSKVDDYILLCKLPEMGNIFQILISIKNRLEQQKTKKQQIQLSKERQLIQLFTPLSVSQKPKAIPLPRQQKISSSPQSQPPPITPPIPAQVQLPVQQLVQQQIQQQKMVYITKFRHLPVTKKLEQTETQYDQRNKKVENIKKINEAHIYQQIEQNNIIPMIYLTAQEKQANVIYLVDVTNLSYEFYGGYVKWNSLNQKQEFWNFLSHEKNLEGKKIYWVFINQGDYVRGSDQWINILERTNKGILLEVACLTEEKKDCYRVPNMPNPLDDLTLLVLEKGLKDMRSAMLKKHNKKLLELEEELSEIKQHENWESKVVLRTRHTKILNKIRKLRRKEFPMVDRITKDFYTDFSPIYEQQQQR